MKKEIPILFSTPMVQAILEGRKTQTRRIMKPQPVVGENEWKWVGTRPKAKRASGAISAWGPNVSPSDCFVLAGSCPCGRPGDLLWVRETWRPINWDADEGTVNVEYKDRFTHEVEMFAHDLSKVDDFITKLADKMDKKCEPTVNEEEEYFSYTKEQIDKFMPWKPSIHMPKAAARIWLEVVSVKVERLQDISRDDSIAEGVSHFNHGYGGSPQGVWYNDYEHGGGHTMGPYQSFRGLWKTINGPESWKANPWVWVVEFRKIEKP
jgi:hypothetical protein